MCKAPRLLFGNLTPCRKCVPCHVNQRREITVRLMVEDSHSVESFFVTLTYDEENKPSDGKLKMQEVSDYVRSVRREFGFNLVRYYFVGEYGPKKGRPHYHGLFFVSERGRLDLSRLRALWSGAELTLPDGRPNTKGVVILPVNEKVLTYVAGYLLKKQKGHPPMRCSRMPGIGYQLVEKLVAHGSIPPFLLVGGKKWPVPQYYLRKLKERGVIKDDESAKAYRREQVQELLRRAESVIQDNISKKVGKYRGLSSLDARARIRQEIIDEAFVIEARNRGAANSSAFEIKLKERLDL